MYAPRKLRGTKRLATQDCTATQPPRVISPRTTARPATSIVPSIVAFKITYSSKY